MAEIQKTKPCNRRNASQNSNQNNRKRQNSTNQNQNDSKTVKQNTNIDDQQRRIRSNSVPSRQSDVESNPAEPQGSKQRSFKSISRSSSMSLPPASQMLTSEQAFRPLMLPPCHLPPMNIVLRPTSYLPVLQVPPGPIMSPQPAIIQPRATCPSTGIIYPQCIPNQHPSSTYNQSSYSYYSCPSYYVNSQQSMKCSPTTMPKETPTAKMLSVPLPDSSRIRLSEEMNQQKSDSDSQCNQEGEAANEEVSDMDKRPPFDSIEVEASSSSEMTEDDMLENDYFLDKFHNPPRPNEIPVPEIFLQDSLEVSS